MPELGKKRLQIFAVEFVEDAVANSRCSGTRWKLDRRRESGGNQETTVNKVISELFACRFRKAKGKLRWLVLWTKSWKRWITALANRLFERSSGAQWRIRVCIYTLKYSSFDKVCFTKAYKCTRQCGIMLLWIMLVWGVLIDAVRCFSMTEKSTSTCTLTSL